MICKWCGGNLIPSDSKCKRCGREVPVLSDCGGFYDLVPDARRVSEVSCESDIHVPDADDKSYQQKLINDMEFERNKKNNKNNKKKFLFLPMLTFVGVAFVAIIACKMYGKVNRYTSEIEVLRKDIKEIASDIAAFEVQMESLDEIKLNEITEPIAELITEPANPNISEQDVSFLVEILNQRDIKEYGTSFDLGECDNEVSVSYILDNKSNNNISILYSIEGDEIVELDFKSENEYDTRTVSVAYKLDEKVFGVSSAPATCEWQYRIGSKGIWSPIPKDIFTQADVFGQTRLSVSESSWQNMLDNNKETFELRCKIYRTNADGGTATLFIESISFYQETNGEIFIND